MATNEPEGAVPPAQDGPAAPEPALRLRRAQRDQVAPVPMYLDALLPEDHLARLIWAAVARLDLTQFTRELVVVESGPGRGAADPAVLVALWVDATSQGVVHARALARLCTEHLAYIWLCGGVSVNYHSLSDVRVRHEDALQAVFTQIVGCLRHAGLIEFAHVAQDGIRVRASAGAAACHRRPTLEQSLTEAQTCLEAVLHQPAEAGGGSGAAPAASRRRRAATIECVNAQARCRFGLQQVPVRGLAKVRCLVGWLALTHNLLLWLQVLVTPDGQPLRQVA